MVTGFFITFFLSDTLMVAVYGLANVAAGLVRRYASSCAALAVTVSDEWRQEKRGGPPQRRQAYALLPAAVATPATAPLSLFDAVVGFDAVSAGPWARLRHALLRLSLWVALPVHRFAVRAGVDVGNMGTVPATMTRRRARGAVAAAAALLVVLPLTIGGTVSCFTSPAGLASFMVGRAHWSAGAAARAAAVAPGAAAPAQDAWGALVAESIHVTTSAQVRC